MDGFSCTFFKIDFAPAILQTQIKQRDPVIDQVFMFSPLRNL